MGIQNPIILGLWCSPERPASAPPRLTWLEVGALLLPSFVRFLQGLHGLGVEPPYLVLVSLLGVKGVHMNVGTSDMWPDDDIVVLADDQLHFGDVILETVPASVQRKRPASPLV